MKNKKKQSGFTLVEMMLVVSVVAALGGISAPIYQSFQIKNDLDVVTNNVAQTLKRAQVLSQASDGDAAWGVKAQSGSLVLFKGATFAARDAAYDEIFDIPGTIAPSGVTEFNFAKMTGLPASPGTLILTSSSGDARNVIVNAKGMVAY